MTGVGIRRKTGGKIGYGLAVDIMGGIEHFLDSRVNFTFYFCILPV
jgi:hypothetical protein